MKQKKLSYATYRTNPLVHYAKVKKISSYMFIRQHIRFLNDNFTIKFYLSHLYEYWYAHKKKIIQNIVKENKERRYRERLLPPHTKITWLGSNKSKAQAAPTKFLVKLMSNFKIHDHINTKIIPLHNQLQVRGILTSLMSS